MSQGRNNSIKIALKVRVQLLLRMSDLKVVLSNLERGFRRKGPLELGVVLIILTISICQNKSEFPLIINKKRLKYNEIMLY